MGLRLAEIPSHRLKTMVVFPLFVVIRRFDTGSHGFGFSIACYGIYRGGGEILTSRKGNQFAPRGNHGLNAVDGCAIHVHLETRVEPIMCVGI